MADNLRPLTDEGRKRTFQAAKGIRRLNLGIEAVYTSPLPRAHQTAEILASILGLPRPQSADELLPGTSLNHLTEWLAGIPEETAALVGHEPDLSEIVSDLIGAPDSISLDFKKAGVAVVSLRRRDPRAGGSLSLFLTPAALRKLGK